MSIGFPPGLLLIAAACVLPFLRGRLLAVCALAASGVTLAVTILAITGQVDPLTVPFLPGLDLHLLQVNAPTKVFATIFALMAFIGTLFAINEERRAELAGAYLYAGSAICATFAGDLITLFVFWELMAIGSTLVVWTGRQKDSGPAGWRYAAVHFVGGALMLAGIAAYAAQGGDFAIPVNPLDSELVRSLSRLDSAAAWLILIGILVNAGAPPLGAWLPDAYPEASASGTVFLSAFTTKTAVYVLMMLYAGTTLLVWVGIAMALYGIIYAILEVDVRRILAYSIINQVGFMICAIGFGSELALTGASAHAFSHIIYKALLLMAAGSVLTMTGKRKCTEMGGMYRSMPITMVCGIIGALAISAVPLTSSFATKSLITAAASEMGRGSPALLDYQTLAWFNFSLIAVGILIHVAIKFPWIMFMKKDSGLRPTDPPWNMRIAMIALAGLCIGIGVWPESLYALLPYQPLYHGENGALHAYHAWTMSHVLGSLGSLALAAGAFFILLPVVKRMLFSTRDTDWIYRQLFPVLWRVMLLPALRVVGKGHNFLIQSLPQHATRYVQAWRARRTVDCKMDVGQIHAHFKVDLFWDRGRQWAVGGVLVIITGLLGFCLLILLT